MPTRRSPAVVLDLGANIECDAANLVQFAVMGEVFARVMLGVAKPTRRPPQHRHRGAQGRRRAARGGGLAARRATLPIEFHGFVEGRDVTSGEVDVVVTDGFTGNVALKVAEGTAALYTQACARRSSSSLLRQARLSIWRGRPCSSLRQRFDPRRYNGAMFLGLNGIVVKSHGGTDALGFANAIGGRGRPRAARAPTSGSPTSCASSSKRPCAPGRRGLPDAAAAMLRARVDRQRRLSAGQGGQQRRARAHGRHHATTGSASAPASASATSRPRAS